jgi:hypothetical protein
VIPFFPSSASKKVGIGVSHLDLKTRATLTGDRARGKKSEFLTTLQKKATIPSYKREREQARDF